MTAAELVGVMMIFLTILTMVIGLITLLIKFQLSNISHNQNVLADTQKEFITHIEKEREERKNEVRRIYEKLDKNMEMQIRTDERVLSVIKTCQRNHPGMFSESHKEGCS